MNLIGAATVDLKMMPPDTSHKRTAIRGSLLHFLSAPDPDPELVVPENSYEYYEDGLLIIEDGLVEFCGAYPENFEKIDAHTQIIDHSGKLLMPGFVDTHLHYPQTDIIASDGRSLLDWLNTYTFPAEGRFKDPEYAGTVVDFFLDELIRNGTTTAMVMPTVHPHSAEIFFQKCAELGLRMVCGKIMMDQNAPDCLLDTLQTGGESSKRLIEKWHGKKRLSYAVTPRFAITSSEGQLKKAGELLQAYPDVYLHTHLSENQEEIDTVARLFPWSKSYLDVYDHFGLVGEKSVFAHSIHLDEKDYRLLSEKRAAISFCPSSNLALGSGLFNMAAAETFNIRLGIGTDVGGGTSFSMFKTLSDAYKVLQLRGQHLSSLKAFYLATLGGAKSLSLDDIIGNFQPGKEADFIVINWDATPLLSRRIQSAKTLEEKLFILMILGDDRAISFTHVMGKKWQ